MVGSTEGYYQHSYCIGWFITENCITLYLLFIVKCIVKMEQYGKSVLTWTHFALGVTDLFFQFSFGIKQSVRGHSVGNVDYNSEEFLNL